MSIRRRAKEKHEIIERIKSMFFLCMYCDNPSPMAASTVEYQGKNDGTFATVFFICPDCHNKFIVKIQDAGKVPK